MTFPQMPMPSSRRQFLATGLAVAAAAATSRLRAESSTVPPAPSVRPEPQRGARQELETVQAFVRAGHADLVRVKEMLAQDPKLVFAAWDWGGGDWETALGGASHLGNRELARYLLSQGARLDSFCAAMLGQREVVAALLAANPSVATTRGPHGYSLLYHVAISGDVAMAEALQPLLPPGTKDHNQALGAAVRDGHLAMTAWLFEHGEVNPNAEDALGRTPLKLARDKGFTEVAEELRRRGARDNK